MSPEMPDGPGSHPDNVERLREGLESLRNELEAAEQKLGRYKEELEKAKGALQKLSKRHSAQHIINHIQDILIDVSGCDSASALRTEVNAMKKTTSHALERFTVSQRVATWEGYVKIQGEGVKNLRILYTSASDILKQLEERGTK